MATRQKKLNPKQNLHEKKQIDTTRGRELLKEGKVKIIRKKTG